MGVLDYPLKDPSRFLISSDVVTVRYSYLVLFELVFDFGALT